jgi:hypothetical protein
MRSTHQPASPASAGRTPTSSVSPGDGVTRPVATSQSYTSPANASAASRYRSSLTRSAASARARSTARQVRSAVSSTRATSSAAHARGLVLWTARVATQSPPLTNGTATYARMPAAASTVRSGSVIVGSVATSADTAVRPARYVWTSRSPKSRCRNRPAVGGRPFPYPWWMRTSSPTVSP